MRSPDVPAPLTDTTTDIVRGPNFLGSYAIMQTCPTEQCLMHLPELFASMTAACNFSCIVVTHPAHTCLELDI